MRAWSCAFICISRHWRTHGRDGVLSVDSPLTAPPLSLPSQAPASPTEMVPNPQTPQTRRSRRRYDGREAVCQSTHLCLLHRCRCRRRLRRFLQEWCQTLRHRRPVGAAEGTTAAKRSVSQRICACSTASLPSQAPASPTEIEANPQTPRSRRSRRRYDGSEGGLTSGECVGAFAVAVFHCILS